MSKHHNYNNYSKPDFKTEQVEEKKVFEEPAIEELTEAPKTIMGIVSDCTKLNVRKAPNSEADVVCTIPVSTKVQIDEVESTEDFYKVCTEAGVEGYCMKKFIMIEQ